MGSKFSKREWLLVIALLMAIELGVFYQSYLYDDREKIIGFISFAGTIVSIILAVLAIIYSFYQSYSQSNTSAQINENLVKVNAIADFMKQKSDEISSSVNSLAQIEEKLNVSLATMAGLKQASDALADKFEKFVIGTKENPNLSSSGRETVASSEVELSSDEKETLDQPEETE